MKTAIILTSDEVQSKQSRVNWAEGLILQLPKEHDGRNSWLLNYGVCAEAVTLRMNDKRSRENLGYTSRNLLWSHETDSLEGAS